MAAKTKRSKFPRTYSYGGYWTGSLCASAITGNPLFCLIVSFILIVIAIFFDRKKYALS